MNLDYIKLALNAAKYHEDKVFQLSLGDNENYDISLFYHARGYFWELSSIWDYVLQQANSQTFNYPPRDVKRNLPKDIENQKPNYKYINLLNKYSSSNELKKIQFTRDYAHKWQFNTLILVAHLGEHSRNINDIKSVAFDNSDKKEIRLDQQIFIDRSDLEFINRMITELSQSGFFN